MESCTRMKIWKTRFGGTRHVDDVKAGEDAFDAEEQDETISVEELTEIVKDAGNEFDQDLTTRTLRHGKKISIVNSMLEQIRVEE